MKNKAQNLKVSIFLFSIFYFLFSIFSVGAQTTASQPQFMVSWRAYSYVPSWYTGKIFPTKGSKIDVAFELIDNGKIADLSEVKVRWYINDDLVLNEKNGLGIKSHFFKIKDFPGQDIKVKIVIVDYIRKYLYYTIIIPIIFPETIIDAPYSNSQINKGITLLVAYPFFFNIPADFKNLSFNWNVNDQPAESGGNNQELDLNIDQKTPSGFIADVKLLIKNLSDEMEFAGGNVKLNVK